MECTIVHNPVSRRGKRVADRLQQFVAEHAGRHDVRWVTQPDPDVVPSGERVIVGGGDGTVNLTARWLLEHDAAMPIAIVPGGTGNNLARGLGLSTQTRPAMDLAFHGRTVRNVDGMVVEAEGREAQYRGVFLQSAALGFPADTSRRFDDLRHTWWFKPIAKGLGDPAYTLVALAGLPGLKRRERRGFAGNPLRIELPDETIEVPIFAMFLGNEPTVGGGFVPTPKASTTSGLLDLCWVRGAPPDPYLKIFRQLRTGAHVGLTGSVGYRQTPGPVRLRLGEPSTLMADGELPLRDAIEVRVSVLAGRFPIVVPDGAG